MLCALLNETFPSFPSFDIETKQCFITIQFRQTANIYTVPEFELNKRPITPGGWKYDRRLKTYSKVARRVTYLKILI